MNNSSETGLKNLGEIRGNVLLAIKKRKISGFLGFSKGSGLKKADAFYIINAPNYEPGEM